MTKPGAKTVRRPTIPLFEQEVVLSIARELGRRPGQAPDTSLTSLSHLEVELRSLDRRSAEYIVMMTAIEALDDLIRQHLAVVFCDSEAGDRYMLEFDGFLSEAEMQLASAEFEKVVLRLRNGHNGIEAVVDGLTHVALEPEWLD